MKKMIKRKMYKLIELMIEKLTPGLAQTINQMCLGKRQMPRPSIEFMKTYFKDHPIIGVEIGVAKGDNSQSILTELNVNHLTLVDIWEKWEEPLELKSYDKMKIYVNGMFMIGKEKEKLTDKFKFGSFDYIQNKFRGMDGQVTILRSKSQDASKKFDDESIDFIYIDASHNYSDVIVDLQSWYPKVKIGGVIAGHDSHLLDVLQAWIDFSHAENEHLKVRFPDLFFTKKIENN